MAERREPERLRPHLAEVRCPVRLLLGTATHEGGVSAEEVAVLAPALPAFAVGSVAGAGPFPLAEPPAPGVRGVRRGPGAAGAAAPAPAGSLHLPRPPPAPSP